MQKKATRDAYGQALVELGRKYDNIVVLDADLSKSTKTEHFAKEFPERFFQMGIAEQDMMATAAGLAFSGKVAFASTFAIFATGRAFEQIRNSICYPAVSVKICATHAGLTVGEDGGSHQSVEDIAIMRAVPNMTVIVPADGVSTEKALTAIYEHEGPVYLRLGRPAVPVIYDEDYEFKIGKATKLKEGQDAAIIATGIMVSLAIDAARMLKEEGLSVQVWDMSTIKPLDIEAVKIAAKTGAIVTAEEHSVIGGLGGAVAEALAKNSPCHMGFVGVEDTFGESGTPAELMEKYNLTAESIKSKVRETISKKSSC
ncbi:MAG: transketolase family protein [Firmicutes bacterium]|nr:transketolase family protein [Bacillota bacterium]MDD4694211.1 transketolase family protein [Bacillota bacterium]